MATPWPRENVNWADDVDAADQPPPQRATGFKAPPGQYLPLVYDLYNGEALQLPPTDRLGEACDAACVPLLGTTVVPEVGPMAGKPIHTGAYLLRAVVVDDKGHSVFDLDSRL